MKKTKIEWCDSTWNPVTGCLHGCDYCYARRIAERFGGGCHVAPHYHDVEDPVENVGVIYEYANETNHVLDRPYFDAKLEKTAPYPYYFDPSFHRYKLDEPTRWIKPRTIFVCSMADLFGEWVPNNWIEEVFAACEKAPQHRYLFLTKNVERYVQHGVPIADNLWYGTSITDETNASSFNYLPAFCNTFVSIEPLMADIARENNIMFRQADWFIIGAETGRRKHKVIPQKEWIINILQECDRWKKPVFMKDSLLPIMGEENMRREFPWEVD